MSLNEFKNYNIVCLNLDLSPIESNAWLAGFIDSDGSFSIKGFTGNIRTYIAVQFFLTQRKLDISGLDMEKIMNIISNFVESTLKSRSIILNNKVFEHYTITTSNKNKVFMASGHQIKFYIWLLATLYDFWS